MAITGPLQLHLGGTEAREGWKIVAALPGPDVDLVCDPRSLVEFADDSVDAIYAAWFYQRLGFRDELTAAFTAAFLKQSGFRTARRLPSFGLFDDMSSAKRFGRVISLNIEATK